MSNAHTPAPWKFDEATGIVYASIPDDEAGYVWEPSIAHTQSPDMECLSHKTAIANARLIAAAPELLALLEEFDGVFSNVLTNRAYSKADKSLAKRMQDAARAAIAKAKGE